MMSAPMITRSQRCVFVSSYVLSLFTLLDINCTKETAFD
jgi:hypothetical protein